jgi:hypothetical protein
VTLLEKRVKEYDIPSWPGEAQFERIIVFQIPAEADAQEKIGSLFVPQKTRDAQLAKSPRGIVVSAGLKALDIMYSHGMELGEMIWLASWSPFRVQTEVKSGGATVEFFFMSVGDIILSEDMKARFASGEVYLQLQGDTHVIVRDGKQLPLPVAPDVNAMTMV